MKRARTDRCRARRNRMSRWTGLAVGVVVRLDGDSGPAGVLGAGRRDAVYAAAFSAERLERTSQKAPLAQLFGGGGRAVGRPFGRPQQQAWNPLGRNDQSR